MFCGIPGGGAQYFGTTEQGVTIEITGEMMPVMNDLAGPKVPYSMMYVGEQGRISATMSRWNERVYDRISCKWNPTAGATRGFETNQARGTLLIEEGVAYEMWCLYPFGPGGLSSVAAMGSLAKAGFHFLACWLTGPEKLEPGVRPYKEHFTWQSLGVFNPSTGGFTHYDFNMNGLPAVD